VLPHQRSFGDPEAMAEERRLFYVGITRAMDRLFLLRSFRRRLVGSSTVTAPSRFLDDIPADVIEGDRIVRPLRERAAYARQTRWESPVEAAVEPRFRAGMRVVHPSFGEGIVLETRVDRDDEEVTVAFETAGIKRLAGSIAPLKPVDSGQ
jgi:DNA helicase-2/ATP-dependent DNA helicase PcrA